MISLLLAVIYLAFISLGLPDSLLGSAWPIMYQEMEVPLSYAGIITMIIAAGTIVSSLQSDRLTKKLGTGKVTAISVGITAVALLGFSMSQSFVALCLWAIPYGLGAGSVDASLNNYVALHYESKHMSWLHCMWGVGAAAGPYIMGFVLAHQNPWSSGYLAIAGIQAVLTLLLILSLPLWKNRPIINDQSGQAVKEQALPLKEVIKIPHAKDIMICFFCYCAIEQTAGIWASSYLNLYKGVSAESAAGFASMFYIGITVGRAINGFIAMRLKDKQMIHIGMSIMVAGIITIMLPFSAMVSIIGFIMVGIGCAPIYPCIIHSTPEFFGEERSQAVIGVQMASAYIGILVMPPLFGVIANSYSIALLPIFLFVVFIVMVLMYERLHQGGKAS